MELQEYDEECIIGMFQTLINLELELIQFYTELESMITECLMNFSIESFQILKEKIRVHREHIQLLRKQLRNIIREYINNDEATQQSAIYEYYKALKEVYAQRKQLSDVLDNIDLASDDEIESDSD